jgi:AAA+ lid domain
LRAGRFDRIVQCPLPDRFGRLAILEVHARKLQLSADVDLDKVARLTPNTCGADLAAIVNEGKLCCWLGYSEDAIVLFTYYFLLMTHHVLFCFLYTNLLLCI